MKQRGINYDTGALQEKDSRLAREALTTCVHELRKPG